MGSLGLWLLHTAATRTRFPFLSDLPAGGVCVASEPKEDYIHFLVLTDVCGNRTYGVVAQYYRPLHVGGSVAVLWVWGGPFLLLLLFIVV